MSGFWDATEAGLSEMDAFLRTMPTATMFPRSNLAAHGLSGDHPHTMRCHFDPSGAFLGITRNGIVLPFWLSGTDPEPLAEALRGMPLTGVIGPSEIVRPLLAALSLTEAKMQKDADEPQFRLDLSDLAIPDRPGELFPTDTFPEIAARWRLASNRETGAGAQDAEGAREEITRGIAAETGRLLVADGEPLAMTAFNAVLPDIVQVGGVYTPPEHRGRRHAGRAVALHLAEARARGVASATLFAASDAAVRAYLRLGFVRIGTFALVLFAGPVTP